jgi:hypothetical protein
MKGTHTPARILLVASLAAVAATSSCDSNPWEDFGGARTTWQQARIASYTFEYRALGFRPHFHAIITVQDGVPTTADVIDGGGIGSPTSPEYYPTVDGLFEEVENTLANPNDTTSVSYDPELGYPTRLWSESGEEGFGFEVLSLTPAP